MNILSAVFTWIASHWAWILFALLRHIWISVVGTGMAFLVGCLIGILLVRFRKAAEPVISLTNLGQMLPSIAILGLFIPIFGLGVLPALVTMFVKAIMPIIKNTYVGIISVDPAVREAAKGMGLTRYQLLRSVEIPLSLPAVIEGIRTGLTLAVSIMTMASLVGAGGLGDFVFTGLQLLQNDVLLVGAILTSALAICLYSLLGFLLSRQRRWT
jgi:osmoprotectant transport system permease protein